jgi:RNA polymerase sigma-70 factor, ECF subfamily
VCAMDLRERAENELLVLQCQEGDVAAFRQLVEHWQPRLWRHAWRLTGDEDAAWDAMQEAWIAISGGLRRLAEPAAFSAWAYRIVGHKCCDWLRRHRRQRQLEELYGTEVRESYEPEEESERVANLKEAVARLPGPLRAIISLHYEDGFGTAEIATILDVPEGTVKSRLFYARKRLRDFLEKSNERAE